MSKHSTGARQRGRWMPLAAAVLLAVACDGPGADEAPQAGASGAGEPDTSAITTTTAALSASYRVLSDAEKEAALLGIMEAFVTRIETRWNGTGYGDVSGPGVRQARGLGSIAYIYATLLTA